MLTRFVVVMGDKPQPSESFYDIRRGRQKPWGPILKRIDEAIRANAAAERVRAIGEFFMAYIDDQLEERERNQGGRR